MPPAPPDLREPTDPRNPPTAARRGRLVAVYALAAGLWFGLSGAAIAWLLTDPGERAVAGALQEGLFVAVTAALLYRRVGRRWRPADPDRRALLGPERTLGLLLALAEATPDALYAKDREGRYLMFNRAAARSTGTRVDDVLGRDDAAIFPPAQAAVIRDHDERVMVQGRAQTFEEEMDTAQGRLTFMSTKGPLHDAQGEVVGMFGISRDITERLAADALLRASEQRYRSLFDASAEPMWVFDVETLAFLAVNDAALRQYGYAHAEFLAMTIADIGPSDERGRLVQRLAQPAAAVVHEGIWTHRCKNGRLKEVEIVSNGLVFDGRAARLVLAHDVTERRELERQAQASREAALAAGALLRDVLARVGDGLVGLDRDGCYTYLNDQAARMLGHETPQDLIGRNLWSGLPAGIGGELRRACEEAMASQQPVVFEACYEPWNRWFENRVYPSPDGMSIYFSDVSVRKRAESALQLSEQRYRLAAAGGQVWDWNIATGAVDFPDGYWHRLGCAVPPATESAERFEALMHPDDRPRWHETMRAHLRHRAPYRLEYRARHADGHWHWFLTQGESVRDADGRATYLAGTTFDITERKRAEAALGEADAYRRNLLDQLGDGVLLLDRDQRLLDANREALAMLGYGPQELPQLEVGDLIPAAERPRADAEIGAILAGRVHLGERELMRKDGTRFIAEASVRRLDDQRFVAVLRDITARRASDNALRTYRLELSELAQRLLSQEKTTTQRVAQVLHDHLGQTLAATRLNFDAFVSMHGPVMPPPLQAQAERIALLLAQAVREVRHVLVDLRPPLLDDQGLAGALDNEIGSRAIAGDSADVLLEVHDSVAAQRWPGEVEYAAFMVAREAVGNARQHADASLIRVVLGGAAHAISLEVIDDGKGIAEQLIHGRPGHLGIVGMRERALAIGAHFSVTRAAEGGTRVTLRWPAAVPVPGS